MAAGPLGLFRQKRQQATIIILYMNFLGATALLHLLPTLYESAGLPTT